MLPSHTSSLILARTAFASFPLTSQSKVATTLKIFHPLNICFTVHLFPADTHKRNDVGCDGMRTRKKFRHLQPKVFRAIITLWVELRMNQFSLNMYRHHHIIWMISIFKRPTFFCSIFLSSSPRETASSVFFAFSPCVDHKSFSCPQMGKIFLSKF